MQSLAQKLSQIILIIALPLAVLAESLGLPSEAMAAVQADCTDAGSDGITDNKIIVATKISESNCYTDGVEDQLEINWALAQANTASEMIVYIKSGTYIIDNSIVIYSDTVFEGEGSSSIIKLNKTNNQIKINLITNADKIKGNYNIKIQNMLLDGDRIHNIYHKNGSTGSNAIYFEKVDNVLIFNINITGTTLDAIYFIQSSNSVIDSVNVYDIGHDAYRVSSGSKKIIVGNSYAKNTGAHCMRLYNSNNSVIKNNKFILCGDYGILLQAEGKGSTSDNLIQDNIINTSAASAFEGIYLFNKNTTSIVIRNTIQNNLLYSIFSHGIRLTNAADSLVNLNTIYQTINTNTDGIFVEGFVLNNNIVRNNIIVGAARYGINGTINSSFNLFWLNKNNTYGENVQGKIGDISFDPLFSDPANGDFHLQSQAGRWNGAAWVTDAVTSPAIASGDPTTVIANCPSWGCPSRIEMGAYGNTTEASQGFIAPTPTPSITPTPTPSLTPTPAPKFSADLNSDGKVNSQDFAILMSAWNSTDKPKADINQDGLVDSLDFGLMMSFWG